MGRWANRLGGLAGQPPPRRSRRQLAWWTLAGLMMAYAAWKLSGLAWGTGDAEEEWRGTPRPSNGVRAVGLEPTRGDPTRT